MNEHTPGPWDAVQDGLGHWMVGAPKREPSGDVSAYYKWQSAPSADVQLSEADARLIAAAPDLLEAARRLEQALSENIEDVPGSDVSCERDTLRDAVARATGQEVDAL